MVCRQLSRVLIISFFVFILSSQVWSRRGRCGTSSLPPALGRSVTEGREAQQGAWPWMAAIMKKTESDISVPWCTGFLIDEKHVLSAAHCFDGSQPSFFSARIGHVNLTMADSYSIHRIAIPDGYREGMFYDDIALLTLSKEVEIPGFNPVCLPPSRALRIPPGRGTTVVGWGSTVPSGPMSTILNQLSDIPVLSNGVCDEAYSGSFGDELPRGITDGMICAGFQNETGEDSCVGASGSPLLFREANRWYAVGAVSFGYSCGRLDFPGVYTRLSNHMTWINEQKKVEKDETSTTNITPETEPRVIPSIPTKVEKDETSMTNITPESEPTVIPSIPADTCGKNFEHLYNNGVKEEDTRQGEWPWMVPVLKYNNRSGEYNPLCRAFLIDRRHGLAEANCFGDNPPSLFRTRVGQVNRTQFGEMYEIANLVVHKNFKKGEYYHDIVLFSLAKEVDIPNFNPVCLPPRGGFGNLTGRAALHVGWTRVSDWTLEQAHVSIEDNSVCDEHYDGGSTSSRLPQGMTSELICSSSTENNSCAGGYGAPLMIKEQGKWYAVGVTGFYRNCDDPRVYMRVSEYLDWINKQKASLAQSIE